MTMIDQTKLSDWDGCQAKLDYFDQVRVNELEHSLADYKAKQNNHI